MNVCSICVNAVTVYGRLDTRCMFSDDYEEGVIVRYSSMRKGFACECRHGQLKMSKGGDLNLLQPECLTL